MEQEKPVNPEKAQRQLMSQSDRVNEVADRMEKLHGTTIPTERRKFFESQVDRLEDIVWLLNK
jgi:hypothetical protein